MTKLRENSERLHYELIEMINALKPYGGRTVLPITDGAKDPDTPLGLYVLWLDDLERRNLIELHLSPENKTLADQGIFTITVHQPQLRDYLEELYAHRRISLEKLDYPTLYAVWDIAREIEHELLVTTNQEFNISNSKTDEADYPR